MEFPVARPDVIRAINQRWLLKFWKHHVGDACAPNWQSINTEDLKQMSGNLALFDVKSFPQGPRFLIRYQGPSVREAYGSIDAKDRFLDEILPASRAGYSLAAYHQVVKYKRPVYTIQDLTDRSGRIVHYERLVLPFARDGQTIDRMLTSFEFVCLDGAFDAHDLMRTQAKPPPLRFRASIDITTAATLA